MRAVAVLLLLTPFGSADETEQRVRELVPLLGSDDPLQRIDASREIFALGEAALEALERVRTDDPEVARLVRGLIRRNKSLKLLLDAPSGVQNIGSPLKVEVHLLNNTDTTMLIGLTTRSRRGLGTMSGFVLKVKGKPDRRLRPDQVELLEPQERQLLLEPTETMRVSITLDGQDSPLRRPGNIELSIAFDGYLAHAIVGGRGVGRAKKVTGIQVVLREVLETPKVTIRARGRKPAELDKALRSRDRKTFQSALAELMLREDEAVLLTLRRHIANPFLRVRAIARIGAAAKEEDLELLRAAASSTDERIEVRVAAVSGLGNYKHRKARTKLMSLVHNSLLRNAAVTALTRHESATTIDCFVRLLQRNYHEGQWSRDARAAILKWTNRQVDNRPSEIDAFERWWRRNRQRWIKGRK